MMTKRIIISIALIAALLCTVFMPAYSSVVTAVEDEATLQNEEVAAVNEDEVITAADEGNQTVTLSDKIGWKEQQYNANMSPAYVSRNTAEESVDTQSGVLTLSQVDVSIPLSKDKFELKRIFSSNNAMADYTFAFKNELDKEDSFYMKRYHLGEGWRFSFPMLEVIRDGTGVLNGSDIHTILYHSESGAVYSIKPTMEFSETQNVEPTLMWTIVNHNLKDIILDYDYNEVADNSGFAIESINIIHKKQGITYSFDTNGYIHKITYNNAETEEEVRKRLGLQDSEEVTTYADTITFTYEGDIVKKIKHIDISTKGETKRIQFHYKTFNNTLVVDYLILPNDTGVGYEYSSIGDASILSCVNDVDFYNGSENINNVNRDDKYEFYMDAETVNRVYCDVYGRPITVYSMSDIIYCRENKISHYDYQTVTDPASKWQTRNVVKHQDYFVNGQATSSDEEPTESSTDTDSGVVELEGVTTKKIGMETTYQYPTTDGYIPPSLYYKETFDWDTRETFWETNENTSSECGSFLFNNGYMYSWLRMHSEMLSKNTYDNFVMDATITLGDEHITNHSSAGLMFGVSEYYEANNNFTGYYVRISPCTDNEDNANTIALFKMKADSNNPNKDQEEKLLATKHFNELGLGDKCYPDRAYPIRVKKTDSLIEIYVVDMTTPAITYTEIEAAETYCKAGKVGVRAFQRRSYVTSFSIADKSYEKSVSTIKTDDAGNSITTIDTYDYDNNLIRKTEKYGDYDHVVLTTYDYDKYRMPKQISVTEYDNNGGSLSKTEWFEYDQQGNLLTYVDPMAEDPGEVNETTYYTYDETWCIPTSKTVKKDDNATVTTTYALTLDKRNVRTETVSQTINEVETTLRTTAYTYENYGRVSSIAKTENDKTHNVTYSYGSGDTDYVRKIENGITTCIVTDVLTGNIVEEHTGDENYTKYSYDYANRLTKVEYVSPAETSETTYTYYKAGFYENGVDYSPVAILTTNENGIITRNFYDAYGNIIETTVLENSEVKTTTKREYDSRGNMVKYIDGEENEIVYEYDELNRITKVSCDGKTLLQYEYSYETYNDKNVSVVKNVYENSFDVMIYDKKGREIVRVEGLDTDEEYVYEELGDKTCFEYDYADNKVAVTDANGNCTDFVYDAFGRVTETAYANGDEAICTYNVYDKVETKTEGGVVTEYTYDAGGRLTLEKTHKVGESKGFFVRYAYNEMNLVTDMKKGTCEGTTEKVSEHIGYTYGHRGRLTSVKTYITDSDYQETTYTYDGVGNLLTQTENAGTEVGNCTTTRTYDFANRVVSETVTNSKGETISSVVYTYDDNNNLTSKSVGDVTESYTYDVLGHVVCKTLANGRTVNYTYDMRGNVLTESYERDKPVKEIVTTTYEYDSAGRLVSKTDALNNKTSYTYDNVGNVLREFDPRYSITKNGYVLYNYDERNRKVKTTAAMGSKRTVVEELTYDGLNNITSVKKGTTITAYEYDALGNMAKETNGVGNTVEYTYDGSGRVLTHKDGENNVTEYTYYQNGTPHTIQYTDETTPGTTYVTSDFDATGRYKVTTKDRIGNKTVVMYNIWGNPETVTYYYQTGDEQTPYDVGYTESYTYDQLGRKTSFVNREGTETRYAYDEVGNLLSEKVYEIKMVNEEAVETLLTEKVYTYSNDGLLLSSTDACGNTTVYGYNIVGNVVSILYPEENEDSFVYEQGILIKATRAGIATEYDYDVLGRLLYETTGDRETAYTYDAAGNVLTVTDDEDGTTQYVYDAAGRLMRQATKRADYEYDTVAYGYDANGRVIVEAYNTTPVSSIQYTYDEMGNVTEKSVNNVETTYTYDKLGRVLTETIDGCTTEYSYDDLGNVYVVKDALGNYTLYTYDIMGRVVTQADSVSDAGIENLSNIEAYKNGNTFAKSKTYEYDCLGNLTKETNALGNYNEYTYDACGRVLTVKTPDGETASTKTYDGNGNLSSDKDAKGNTAYYTYTHNRLKTVKDRMGKVVETYTYNAYGEVASVTDALGNVTAYVYDKAGRLTGVTMPEGVTTTYTYDKAGNILTQTDGIDNVTEYEYSAFGRVTSVKYADGNTESYVYDAFGNVTEKTDGNGTVVSYLYDARNNLTQVGYDDKIITYSYDSMNNRTSMDDVSGRYAYTYDSGNRLISVTKDNAAYLDYTYDNLGNVTSVNHLTYTYDACNRMISANGVTYTYDKNGNLAITTYPAGSVTYTYDSNNRVTNVANKVGEAVLTSYAYTYYDNGMEQSKDDGVKLVAYTYDGAGRLATVTETDKTTATVIREATYTYDKTGNRTRLVEVCSGTENINGGAVAFAQKTTEYLYNKANVITLESEIYQNAEGSELARKNTRYVYDKAGNQISETAEFITNAVEGAEEDVNLGDSSVVEVTINEYNGLNQLIGSTFIKGGARTYASYAYNGDNLRVHKTVDNTTTDYVLNGGYVITETKSVTNNGETEAITNKTYLHGLSYHGFTSDAAAYWYFANAHGDITWVVDSSNVTVAEYDYDEFGVLTSEESSIDNDILYAGEFYDRESENYYLRARYYNPSIGRFNSKDPHWNPSNMIYGDIAEATPTPEIRSANYTSYVPEPLKRNEMTNTEQDKVNSLIAETMAFSGNIYNGNLYESYFIGFGTPQEELLFAIINSQKADNVAILQSTNLYVYCSNNPVVFVDPSGNIITCSEEDSGKIIELLNELTHNSLTLEYDKEKGEIIITKVYDTEHHVGQTLVYDLIKSETETNVKIGVENVRDLETKESRQRSWNTKVPMQYDGKTQERKVSGTIEILIDPDDLCKDGTLYTYNISPDNKYVLEKVPAYIEFGHELIHAWRGVWGFYDKRNGGDVYVAYKDDYEHIPWEEAETVGMTCFSTKGDSPRKEYTTYEGIVCENGLRIENGLNPRASYNDGKQIK